MHDDAIVEAMRLATQTTALLEGAATRATRERDIRDLRLAEALARTSSDDLSIIRDPRAA